VRCGVDAARETAYDAEAEAREFRAKFFRRRLPVKRRPP
jgi:hypothetical protein